MTMQEKGVLIIGGGIAGIQSALDLANAGIKVYLVEKTPSIGGAMAQLDKTFPTNDCSICILSPKMVEAGRHYNIKLLTNSEVVGLKGKKGDFIATVKRKARSVIEEKCTGCGTCAEHCPIEGTNPFDVNLGLRKAIYVPFPQAVPLKYTIDRGMCIGCGECEKFCDAKAIDFSQKEEFIELNVGSIILANGFVQLNPEMKKEYGYGRYDNVLTALEFERLLSASGPTGGRVIRLSDGDIPKTIAFIQCVGSRDEKGYKYCSRVCCMYAIKEAEIAKEHEHLIENVYIFYMDMRAYGKGFEDYYRRAEKEGIKFVRGRPGKIYEDENKDLIIRVEDTKTGEIKEVKTNMVVLSPAILPSAENKELGKILGIEVDNYGFFKEKDINGSPFSSTKDGIYIIGCCQSPKDIPDSVAQASGASAKASIPVTRFREFEKKEIRDEIDTTIPRIGVFVCHCGINIGGTVNVPSVVEYAKTLLNVVHVEENLYTCSEDSQKRISETIKEKGLTRVVVASCTPRTHEPIFRETLKKAGLNPYLFELVNIREQCSWVHMHEKDGATEKAKELVRMGVARAKLLEPLKTKEIKVEKSALVIGGGIAGIQSAIDLAEMGFPVHLVEKTAFLGGRVAQLGELSPHNTKSADLLNPLYEKLKTLDINILTNVEIKDVSGFVGNFEITLSEVQRGVEALKCNACGKCAEVCPIEVKDDFDRGYSKRKAIYIHPNSFPNVYAIDYEKCNRCGKCIDACKRGAIRLRMVEKPGRSMVHLKVGAIIITIGADLYNPNGEYGYDDKKEHSNVIANIGLERILNENGPTKGQLLINGRKPRSAVFIMCVGARELNAERSDCSRYCCISTIKQALQLKERGVEDISILYRDIRTFNKGGEELYRKARENGIVFIKYNYEKKPIVEENGNEVIVKVFNPLINENLEINTDVVVLALGVVAKEPDTANLLNMLKVPRSLNGLCLEKHPKLGPLETNTDGIFIAGCIQSPKNIAGTVAQASGASAKAATILARDTIEGEAIVSSVDEELCVGCKTCEHVCPYGAIEVERGEKGNKARVQEVLCKGCGTCSAGCPEKAIKMRHYRDEQILLQSISAIEEVGI